MQYYFSAHAFNSSTAQNKLRDLFRRRKHWNVTSREGKSFRIQTFRRIAFLIRMNSLIIRNDIRTRFRFPGGIMQRRFENVSVCLSLLCSNNVRFPRSQSLREIVMHAFVGQLKESPTDFLNLLECFGGGVICRFGDGVSPVSEPKTAA